MEMSESIAKFAEALAKAQGAMEGAKKDSDNPFFKSKYADLASVWDCCRKPLSENGLAVVQSVSSDEHGITLNTMLAHSSGEWVRDSFFVPCQKKDAQSYGSACSYARRYALQAMVGIPSIDDDGESTMKRTPEPPQQQPRQQPQTPPPATVKDEPKPMSEAQRKKLFAMMKTAGLENDECKDFFAFVNPKTGNAVSQFIEHFDTLKSEWDEARKAA